MFGAKAQSLSRKQYQSKADKYCAVQGAAEVNHLVDFPTDCAFDHVVVIPAFDERADFLHRLHAQFAQSLVVLVINQAQLGRPTPDNFQLLRAALASGQQQWQRDNLSLINWPGDSALLIVDRFNPGREIPKRQGVGLARKIGCDLALALILREQILSPWIHSTDADAVLPTDYFEQTAGLSDCSAAVYRFRHQTPPGPLGTATRRYEQKLEYYVAGLRWAGSPYAFHTIGSCLAVNAEHYALARGFPKRNGGEDFYLLNKLAKMAPIVQCHGEALQLEARASHRVPFGTGPAVEQAMAKPDADITSYDPRVFVHLHELLQQLTLLHGQCDHPQAWAATLDPITRSAWCSLQPAPLYRHLAEQVASDVQARRHIDDWFDAFRTLKVIHYLQARHYPAVPLATALQKAHEQLGFSLAL